MDFKQLEIFSVLAQELHFAQTAKRCYMTASAVTRSIQRLEEELDVVLLLRNNRNVELTLAGRQFADYAIDALQRLKAMKLSLQQQAEQVSGQLRLYGSATAGYGVLSRLLADFRASYPQVELQLHTGDQAAAIETIQSGSEDIAIAALPEELPNGIAFKTLLFSPLRFIIAVEKSQTSEQLEVLQNAKEGVLDIAQLPLIVSERGLARKRLNQWLKKQGVSPNIYAQVSGHEAIVTLVALGFGVGLVPELVIQHSPFRDKIRIIDDAPVLQAFQIGLCAMKTRLTLPVVKAFWDAADPSIFNGEVGNG